MLLACLIIAGCSDSDHFTIEGRIDGAGAQSVTLTYYSRGGLKSSTISARNGVFIFSGNAPAPSLAFITVAPENVRIATIVVRDGDHITVEANLNEPYAAKVTGNSESEETAEWIKDNIAALKSHDEKSINKAVADYVRSNPQKLSSTAILTSFYLSAGNESAADSLYSMLDRNVRQPEMTLAFNSVISSYIGSQSKAPIPFLSLYERRDSIISINPLRYSATLICIVSDNKKSRDSIAARLHQLTGEYDRRKLMAVEISTAPDSASWINSLGRDSVKWLQAWTHGSVSSAPLRKLGINRIPYFIVADSIGQAIYRGPSISNAVKTIKKRL